MRPHAESPRAKSPHEVEDGVSLSAVTFSDPKGAKTSTTIFAGLPVGGATVLAGGYYVPQLSVANFSSSPAHVTVQYSQTAGNTPEVKTIASLVVPAGGTSSADLTDLRGDPDIQNTFEVISDQPPGEVVDNLFSRSETGIRLVELPGKDLDNSHNAGNHPWTVADGTDSTILLFNETAAEEDFPVLISSGQTVWSKKYSLAPLATKAVDINEVIADQVKDDKGSVLPHGLQSGEANWFVTPLFGGTGRVLQSNRSQRSARSFSCGEHSVIIGADIYSNVTSQYAGETNDLGEVEAQFGLTEDSGGCSGDYVGDGDAEYYFWSSLNTSIATIPGAEDGSSVSVEGVSAGTASIEGNVEDADSGDYCEAGTEGEMTVTDDQTPVITGISPSVWPAGSTTSVTFTGQNFGSNTPTLTYSDSTITTMGYSSHSDSEIIASVSVPSGTPNDEEVTVTVTNNGYGGNSFAPVSGGNPPQSGSATATIGGGACFAQLKYRPVYILGVNSGRNHSFWYIQDSDGKQWIIEGGPAGTCPACGNLVDWITQGTISVHYNSGNSVDSSGDTTAWSIGPSSAQCSSVAALHSFAETWTPVTYVLNGAPNSNTFAHEAGTAASFTIATPPPNAPGW